MFRRRAPFTRNVLILAGLGGLALSGPATAAPAGPQILTEDVDRFYRVYDAARGLPSAEALQRDYLDPGTDGLHQFAKLRGFTGESLAAALGKKPQVFAGARQCAAALPGVKRRLGIALARLKQLYPQAKSPPVTIAIGRGTTGGTTSASGVLIGLETLCAADFMDPNLEDRFVHLIAHEYAHVQQPAAQVEDPGASLLFNSVVEGGAELVAELTSGSVGNPQLLVWTKGREKEIETAFVADQDGTDMKGWLYGGPGTREKPGDLGYWVGYRITRAYYQHARDKRAALREIIEVSDPKALLAKSGWYPGIVLRWVRRRSEARRGSLEPSAPLSWPKPPDPIRSWSPSS